GGDGAVGVTALDGAGIPVLSVEQLATRPVAVGELGAARAASEGVLYRVDWVEAPPPAAEGSPPRVAVLGDGIELEAEQHPDLDALIEADAETPGVGVVRAGADECGPAASSTDLAAPARAEAPRI